MCPGCKARVRVTPDGKLYEHRRRTQLLPVKLAGASAMPDGWTRCAWSHKAAPVVEAEGKR